MGTEDVDATRTTRSMEATVAKKRDIVGVTSDLAQDPPPSQPTFCLIRFLFCFNVIRSAHSSRPFILLILLPPFESAPKKLYTHTNLLLFPLLLSDVHNILTVLHT